MLTVESEKLSASSPTIQLYGDSQTKFSEKCKNTVVATDTQPKSEIQVNSRFSNNHVTAIIELELILKHLKGFL